MERQNGAMGELFRRRRSELNLSLKEVENATSIRMSYLQGIEEGRVGTMISPVYAKGFVKQYAQFLNLDGETLVQENPHFFRLPDKQEFSYGIGTLEVRGSPSGGIKWLPNLLWIGGIGVVVLAAWYFARYLGVL
ncbi:MAG: helix-turn-helix domain-containing protein [Verrucomicrobia bacterium]|nr:helix-turn-helix domain-containing protein [Verrucomicrobiota bacterium]